MSTPDFNSTPLDSNVLYAKYIPADTSSEKSVIISVKCDEKFLVDKSICYEDTVQVSIVVQKGLWDIDTVLINGNIAQQVNDSVFNGTMYLSHAKTGTKQIFTVHDKANQVVKDTMTIFYNRPPVFTSIPSFQNVYAESVYTDSVLVSDMDGNTILISTQLKLTYTHSSFVVLSFNTVNAKPLSRTF